MRSRTLISTIALAGMLATSLSTSAYADGGRHRGHGGHGGGHRGNGVAIAAGVLGAIAIGSIIASANANAAPVYSAPPAYYPPPPPARSYYEAPAQYYQPQPQVYYQPAPVYYQPQPAAVVVESGRPWPRHHRPYYGY